MSLSNEDHLWARCEGIRDLPDVDEAIQNLTDNPTADNSTCVVRAIREKVLAELGKPIAWQVTNPGWVGVITWEEESANNYKAMGAKINALVALPITE